MPRSIYSGACDAEGYSGACNAEGYSSACDADLNTFDIELSKQCLPKNELCVAGIGRDGMDDPDLRVHLSREGWRKEVEVQGAIEMSNLKDRVACSGEGWGRPGAICTPVSSRHHLQLLIEACTTVRLLASHQCKPGSIPDFCMWELCRTMPLVGRFSQRPPVSPALSLRRRSILTSITLIGSEDLAVKSSPNLFTHSLYDAWMTKENDTVHSRRCCRVHMTITDARSSTARAIFSITTFYNGACTNLVGQLDGYIACHVGRRTLPIIQGFGNVAPQTVKAVRNQGPERNIHSNHANCEVTWSRQCPQLSRVLCAVVIGTDPSPNTSPVVQRIVITGKGNDLGRIEPYIYTPSTMMWAVISSRLHNMSGAGAPVFDSSQMSTRYSSPFYCNFYRKAFCNATTLDIHQHDTGRNIRVAISSGDTTTCDDPRRNLCGIGRVMEKPASVLRTAVRHHTPRIVTETTVLDTSTLAGGWARTTGLYLGWPVCYPLHDCDNVVAIVITITYILRRIVTETTVLDTSTLAGGWARTTGLFLGWPVCYPLHDCDNVVAIVITITLILRRIVIEATVLETSTLAGGGGGGARTTGLYLGWPVCYPLHDCDNVVAIVITITYNLRRIVTETTVLDTSTHAGGWARTTGLYLGWPVCYPLHDCDNVVAIVITITYILRRIVTETTVLDTSTLAGGWARTTGLYLGWPVCYPLHYCDNVLAIVITITYILRRIVTEATVLDTSTLADGWARTTGLYLGWPVCYPLHDCDNVVAIVITITYILRRIVTEATVLDTSTLADGWARTTGLYLGWPVCYPLHDCDNVVAIVITITYILRRIVTETTVLDTSTLAGGWARTTGLYLGWPVCYPLHDCDKRSSNSDYYHLYPQTNSNRDHSSRNFDTCGWEGGARTTGLYLGWPVCYPLHDCDNVVAIVITITYILRRIVTETTVLETSTLAGGGGHEPLASTSKLRHLLVEGGGARTTGLYLGWPVYYPLHDCDNVVAIVITITYNLRRIVIEATVLERSSNSDYYHLYPQTMYRDHSSRHFDTWGGGGARTGLYSVGRHRQRGGERLTWWRFVTVECEVITIIYLAMYEPVDSTCGGGTTCLPMYETFRTSTCGGGRMAYRGVCYPLLRSVECDIPSRRIDGTVLPGWRCAIVHDCDKTTGLTRLAVCYRYMTATRSSNSDYYHYTSENSNRGHVLELDTCRWWARTTAYSVGDECNETQFRHFDTCGGGPNHWLYSVGGVYRYMTATTLRHLWVGGGGARTTGLYLGWPVCYPLHDCDNVVAIVITITYILRRIVTETTVLETSTLAGGGGGHEPLASTSVGRCAIRYMTATTHFDTCRGGGARTTGLYLGWPVCYPLHDCDNVVEIVITITYILRRIVTEATVLDTSTLAGGWARTTGLYLGWPVCYPLHDCDNVVAIVITITYILRRIVTETTVLDTSTLAGGWARTTGLYLGWPVCYPLPDCDNVVAIVITITYILRRIVTETTVLDTLTLAGGGGGARTTGLYLGWPVCYPLHDCDNVVAIVITITYNLRRIVTEATVLDTSTLAGGWARTTGLYLGWPVCYPLHDCDNVVAIVITITYILRRIVTETTVLDTSTLAGGWARTTGLYLGWPVCYPLHDCDNVVAIVITITYILRRIVTEATVLDTSTLAGGWARTTGLYLGWPVCYPLHDCDNVVAIVITITYILRRIVTEATVLDTSTLAGGWARTTGLYLGWPVCYPLHDCVNVVAIASMEQRRNEREGETGDPRENPLTNGIVRHDSHMRKSGVTQPVIEPGRHGGSQKLYYAEVMRRDETNSTLRRPPPSRCSSVLTQRNIVFDPLAIKWCN
ncbi:hypothetical protein PR048_028042 [Dryococelus australis]|uniref:Uncharacterized protein n=1 Tax=Dryococelus australis TaxID=614101 RepID=A0ABQ9GI70_9NEOP|nr:hypothetical protein PR048_028042 [Dryococelus australis]